MAKSTKVAPPRQRRQSSGEPPVAYTLEFIGGFESLTATGGEVGAAVRSRRSTPACTPGASSS